MAFDPTTNRVPTKLLTEEEKQALMAWPHGWEACSVGPWADAEKPDWGMWIVYRGKPAIPSERPKRMTKKMKTFEYKIEYTWRALEGYDLEKLGEQGWELVSALREKISGDVHFTFYFKRTYTEEEI